MKELTREFNKTVYEIKELTMRKMYDEDVLMYMDADTLRLTQLSATLIEVSGNLLSKQAEMIEEMNRKLDLLLESKRES